MRYLLKFNERLGISLDIENQVKGYMTKIKNNPDKNHFNFLYQCDKGNFFFTLDIKDLPIGNEGSLSVESDDENKNGDIFIITISDRSDESTLLHEVKHIDFYLNQKKCFNNIYYKFLNKLDDLKDELKVNPTKLKEIFYVYDRNEFESKYHSYYKDFDNFLLDLIKNGYLKDKKIEPIDIKICFYSFLSKTEDKSWTWYTYVTNFKFTDYMHKKDINNLFLSLIKDKNIELSGKDLIYSINLYKDVYKYLKNKIFKIFKIDKIKKEDQDKIDKLVNYFESDIRKINKIYRKKMYRLIPLMIEKYVK